MAAAIRVVFGNRRAPGIALNVHVRFRADRHIQFRSVAIKKEIARPMLAIAFTRQVGDLLGCALGFCLAGFVLEPDDRVRVAYVDIVAPKSHSERLHKTRCKDELLIRAAVPVCISQYRYSAGLGLGYENIAVWSKRHPARPV